MNVWQSWSDFEEERRKGDCIGASDGRYSDLA